MPPSVEPHSAKLTELATYDPNHLLDSLIEKLQLKNDAALSRALEVAPPVISKIRHRRLPVGSDHSKPKVDRSSVQTTPKIARKKILIFL